MHTTQRTGRTAGPLRASLALLAATLLAACASTQPVPRQGAGQGPPSVGTQSPPTTGKEAPMLATLVQQGKLPPVEQRLPKEPVVLKPEQPGQYGGTWRVGLRGRGDTAWLERTIGYEGYVRWSPDWKTIEPNVMSHWTVSPDARVYTFTIREGLKWSDGHPVTADDVLFWYEDVRQNKELNKVVLDDLKVTKVDDRTVRFEWKEPNGLLLQRLAGPQMAWILPAHYLKQFHPKYNPARVQEEIQKRQVQDWPALWGIVSRPWDNPERPVLHAWVLKNAVGDGQRVVAERNPYYWKVDPQGRQLPYLDRVVFEIHEDVNTMVLKALNGEIDMQDRHIATLQNKAVFADGQQKGNYTLFNTVPSSMNTAIVALNLAHKDPVLRQIFQDKRFRVALSLAINRKEAIDTLFVGQGEPWQAAPLKGSPFYDPEMAKQYTEYDVARANQLLDETGLKKDASGRRLRPDGKPLVINLEIASSGPSYTKEMIDYGELLKKYWGAVGVEVNLKVEDRTLFYQRKQWDANEHDAGMWGGDGGMEVILEPRWYMPYSDESIWATPWGRWYATRGKSGEEPIPPARKQIELFWELERTGDPARQEHLMKQILQIAKEQFWVIGLSLPPQGYGIVRNDFHNVPKTMWNSWVYPHPAPTNPATYFTTRKER